MYIEPNIPPEDSTFFHTSEELLQNSVMNMAQRTAVSILDTESIFTQ